MSTETEANDNIHTDAERQDKAWQALCSARHRVVDSHAAVGRLVDNARRVAIAAAISGGRPRGVAMGRREPVDPTLPPVPFEVQLDPKALTDAWRAIQDAEDCAHQALHAWIDAAERATRSAVHRAYEAALAEGYAIGSAGGLL